jgi:hypothetical protein
MANQRQSDMGSFTPYSSQLYGMPIIGHCRNAASFPYQREGGAAAGSVKVLLATSPRNDAVFSYSTECVSDIAENAACFSY